jgi:pyruvate decarboxylase
MLHVTCEAVRILHAEDAPYLIDRAIRAALHDHKPAYIEIPCNLANQPCSEPAPYETLLPTDYSDPKNLAAAVDAASALINRSQKPVLLAGSLLRSFGAIDAFRELAEALGCGVAVMPNAKGFFPEEHSQFVGIYWGSVSSPGCEPVVNEADLILAGGAMYNDYSIEGWTAHPQQERTINADPRYLRLPNAEFTGVQTPGSRALRWFARFRITWTQRQLCSWKAAMPGLMASICASPKVLVLR